MDLGFKKKLCLPPSPLTSAQRVFDDCRDRKKIRTFDLGWIFDSPPLKKIKESGYGLEGDQNMAKHRQYSKCSGKN